MANGKVALITGPARGIGRATALEWVARGGRVALVGLEPEKLEDLADEIGEAAWWAEADVRDGESLTIVAKSAVEHFGSIDVGIANAGIIKVGPFADLDEHNFETMLDVNAFGVTRTARALLPYLRDSRGYLMCIASVAAALHMPYTAAYSASKAAVEAFANAIRAEEAKFGVTVGCAYFGAVDTDLAHDALADVETLGAMPVANLVLNRSVPVKRVATAIVNGIDGRKRTVVVPRYMRAVIVGRAVVQPVFEWGSKRLLP